MDREQTCLKRLAVNKRRCGSGGVFDGPDNTETGAANDLDRADATATTPLALWGTGGRKCVADTSVKRSAMGDHRVLDPRMVLNPASLPLSASKYVKLNVGGTLHYTTVGTLTKTDHMLKAMFSGRMDLVTDNEGWVLIDRCGKHFATVLNFLRDGTVPLPENRKEILELQTEARYYCVQPLVEVCEEALGKKQDDYVSLCRVPLVTSTKEEQALISTSKKPVVKLSCNRHNNKYSYTSNSDDNILRNIELFDKLSIRFSERILFIKDVLVSNEICLWSFYGNGQKIIEVDCTSIVYGQDKKHTKVEFPEARIYEETLNVLLYENRDALPDGEVMRVTSGCSRRNVDDDEGGAVAEERERVERGVDRLRRK